MSVMHDVEEYVPAPVRPSPFERLIDEKAWECLGLTGDEFRRRWYDGEYRSDNREPVRLLDRLMRLGRWGL